MPLIKVPKAWELPEREATSEEVYLNRRRFLNGMGRLGAGSLLAAALGPAACQTGQLLSQDEKSTRRSARPSPTADLYPARMNDSFQLDRPLTDEQVAARYNNFYEFTTDKDQVWRVAEQFETRPWEIEITGHIHNAMKIGIDDLVRKMSLEERLYRHRCVEAWAMAVPWTGFMMRDLIRLADPKPHVRYVRFVSFMRSAQAPGQRQPWYAWPYHEGLTMDEAMNELTLLVTGIYGHELPNSHGAPIRLVTPWKYGFKSIKSIVQIQFTDRKPPTFWSTAVPGEYDFQANVNPGIPHPRWSQALERMIGSNEKRKTLLYNGYQDYVAGLYEG